VHSGTGNCTYLSGGCLRASAAEGRCGVQQKHNTTVFLLSHWCREFGHPISSM